MFKKILLTIQALILVALFTACDDDTTGPDDDDDKEQNVNYLNTEIQTMIYSEYTLDEDGNKIDESEHRDSVVNEGEVPKDGRDAHEYKYYTDEENEGDFQEDETRYYSKENNELYINAEFMAEVYSDLSEENNYFNQFLQFEEKWLLAANAEADNGDPWILLQKDDVEFTIESFSVNADITISAKRNGSENVDSRNAHIYDITIRVEAMLPDLGNQEVNFESVTKFWFAPDFCLMKTRREPFSFKVEIFGNQGFEQKFEGKESILIDYNPKSSGNEN